MRWLEAILITNPKTRHSTARLNWVRDELARLGITIVEEISIEELDTLERHLSRHPPYLVIVAGGDGTVSTVAGKLANSDVTMAILPLGTANDFARSLGIPMNLTKATRLVEEGKERTVDLGQLVSQGGTARHFSHAAMVGMSTNFARLASRTPQRYRLGYLTYLLCGLVALWRRQPFECRLRFDGQVEELELLQLSIINAPVFGGFLGIRVRGSKIDDHKLDVLAIENIPLHKLLLAGILSTLHQQHRVAGIRTFQVECIHVEASQRLDITLDGEIAGSVPAELKVADERLQVVTPHDSTDLDDR